MRKLMLVLALIGASALFLGAAPGVASASNCTAASSLHTGWANGFWKFQTQLQSCTDVDLTEMQRNPGCGCPYPGSGWLDTNHQNGLFQAPAAYNVDDYIDGRIGIPMTNSGLATWSIPPWCNVYGYPPGWQFPAAHYFSWRIHSRSQGTWGPWHETRWNETIGC